jgi:hypothetical protein
MLRSTSLFVNGSTRSACGGYGGLTIEGNLLCPSRQKQICPISDKKSI